MAKNKYYVVEKGHEPGIYESWPECQNQVKGYPNAKYKGYPTKEEAERAFNGGIEYKNKMPVKEADKNIDYSLNKDIDVNTISVDGACAGNPGIGEYQLVDVDTKEVIYRSGEFKRTTNNIMEFIALVDCIKYITENNIDKKIYTDSITAISWVRNKKMNTTLSRTKENEDSFFIADKSIEWLKNNNYNVEILKWDTKNWGEIPADFGRK